MLGHAEVRQIFKASGIGKLFLLEAAPYRIDFAKKLGLGEVIDVDTTTVNTLFVVEREEEELLVPAQEEFIVGIDQKQKLITVELPEGLLNLEELEDDR